MTNGATTTEEGGEGRRERRSIKMVVDQLEKDRDDCEQEITSKLNQKEDLEAEILATEKKHSYIEGLLEKLS